MSNFTFTERVRLGKLTDDDIVAMAAAADSLRRVKRLVDDIDTEVENCEVDGGVISRTLADQVNELVDFVGKLN
jgi:hypothetical protein